MSGSQQQPSQQQPIRERGRARLVDATLTQAILIGVAFGLAYIALTIGVKAFWQTALEAHISGASSMNADGSSLSGEEIVRVMRDAPPFPKLLTLLMLPMPTMHSMTNGGALDNWPIILQGAWLGTIMCLQVWQLSVRYKPAPHTSLGAVLILFLMPGVFAYLLTGSVGRALVMFAIGLIVANIPNLFIMLWVFVRNRLGQY